MTPVIVLAVGAALLAVIYLVLILAVYRRFRGTRLVTCPETRETVAVEVAARHAALTAAFTAVELKLTQCSRWPERHNCGQECVRQISAAPEDHPERAR